MVALALGVLRCKADAIPPVAQNDGLSVVSWSRKFSEPIVLPNGETLVTLQDAIAWLAKSVPASEHDTEVQIAAYYLTEAAENNGPMAFARIGMLKAINRNTPRERKPHRWGKRKLKRDK